jgi:hypothetical protein
MPRGQYVRKTRIQPTVVEQPVETDLLVADTDDVNDLVPAEAFVSMPGWDKLDETEQSTVLSEGHGLAHELLVHGTSRMAIGAHLYKLRNVLTPHGLYGRFLKYFHFSKRTADRYVAGYENANKLLPEPIVRAAMARGINIIGDTAMKPLGIYTGAVKKLPPPKNPDTVQANTWLNQIEQVRKDERQAAPAGIISIEPIDAQMALKECFRFINTRYKRLPNNSKTRSAFVRSLVGMILSELGVAGPQTFTPTAVPEDFRAQRGRPREQAAIA